MSTSVHLKYQTQGTKQTLLFKRKSRILFEKKKMERQLNAGLAFQKSHLIFPCHSRLKLCPCSLTGTGKCSLALMKLKVVRATKPIKAIETFELSPSAPHF